jgi:TetR/AcrR family transcriptional regulator, regulator of biofilm formation and stress response
LEGTTDVTDDLVAVEEPSSDGRRRKGQQRRRLLLRATMRVIERDGIGAVSQRTVAKTAGLPPSAVMYYFPTIDDLLVATLTACNDGYLRRLAEFGTAEDALEQLAVLIADGAGERRAQVAAEYELYLMAARRPELRAELGRWTQALDALLARFIDDPVRRTGAAAAIDGLFLRCFCAADPFAAEEVLAVLHRLVVNPNEDDERPDPSRESGLRRPS